MGDRSLYTYSGYSFVFQERLTLCTLCMEWNAAAMPAASRSASTLHGNAAFIQGEGALGKILELPSKEAKHSLVSLLAPTGMCGVTEVLPLGVMKLNFL